MTSEKLEQMLKSEPFRPFVIRLSAGRAIPVNHPEWAVPSPSKRTFVFFEPGEEYEYFRIIDLLHVTTLEPANGSGHRATAKSRKRR